MIHRYFLLHKPYGMESQFKQNYPAPLLGDIAFPFPEGTHAIGRLDKTSEGLLLLTTNKKITALLFESKVPHKRTYVVQVRRKVKEEALQQLRTGVCIRVGKEEWYTTPPTDVTVTEAPGFPSPVLISEYVETTWLQLTLTEGKFRQVRKMVRAAGHPCLRLIRTSIEGIELGNLGAGEVKEIEEGAFFHLLKI